MHAKYYFVIFFLAICTLEFVNALGRGENSEHTFAKNLNGRKGYNGTASKPPKKSSFFRLTAAKIIMGSLGLILFGIFVYYYSLFYPILCRKERNYDVVEHSRDTTPTPNTEKLS